MPDMLEYINNKISRIVSDPRLLSREDKEYAYKNGYEYVCRCMPEKDLRYKFSRNLKFYPVHKNTISSEHSPKCPFSDQYDKNAAAKKKIVPRDKETGEIRAFVFEDITKPLSRSSNDTASTGNKNTESEGREDSRIKALRIIKDLNLEVSQKQASALRRKIRDVYDYNRWLYMTAKDVYLEGRGMYLNAPESPIRFIYEVFKDATATVKQPDGNAKEYSLSKLDYDARAFLEAIQKHGYKCTLWTVYKDKQGSEATKKTYCTLTAMESGLKAFIKEYSREDAPAILNNSSGHVIATGFEYDMEYKDRMGLTQYTRRIGRLWFILTSKFGTYARNGEEAGMHSQVFSFIYDMKNVRYSVADTESPYGAITVDGCSKKLVISFMVERRAALSENDLSLVYDPDNTQAFKIELTEKINELKQAAAGEAAGSE